MIFGLLSIALCHATIVIAGAGFAALLLPGKRGLAEFAAASWLLGCLAVSLSLFAFSHLLPAPANIFAVLLVVLLLGMVGWRRFHAKKLLLCRPAPLDRCEWMLIAGIVAGGFWYAFRLGHQTLGWDGLLVWEFKARLAFANGGAVPAAYYADPAAAWSHPGYPQFLPMLETWLYAIAGDSRQSDIQWLLAPFYPVLLVLLVLAVMRFGETRRTGLVAVALFPFIAFPLSGVGSLGSGYCDAPMSVFYLASATALAGGDTALFATFAAALPWLKRDGVVLWLTLMLLAAWYALPEKKESRLAPARFGTGGTPVLRRLAIILPGFIMVAGWQIFLRRVGAPHHEDFAPFTLPTFLQNTPRAAPLIGEMIRELFNIQNWSLLWPGFIAVALLRHRGRLNRFLILAVALPVAIDAFLFLFSDWASPLNHFRSAFPRLLLHGVPLAWAATVGLAKNAEVNAAPD